MVLLCAAHHANEVTTPEYVLDAARFLLEHKGERRVRAWLAALAVVVVPLVNADGSAAYWNVSDDLGRKNRRVLPTAIGVDLNRNYPFRWNSVETRYNSNDPASNFFRGFEAASEPEVQAMMALAERERFVAALTYHSSAMRLLVPYTTDGVDNPSPSAAWAVADSMVAKLRPFAGQRYSAVKNLYPVDGTEQDWYQHAFGTLAYLLEVPHSSPHGLDLAQAIAASRPAWQVLLDRWVAGPSLSVRAVRAATGEPLRAEIRIAEITVSAGEQWTTHPSTGWFHAMLPAPGHYTVRLVGDGESTEQGVESGAGVARLIVPVESLRAEAR